jgi:DNA polymerase-3 subunit delta'
LDYNAAAQNAVTPSVFMEYRFIGARYERFVAQFRSGRYAHAYLFSGPPGIGKLTFARYLASLVLCESEASPCATCSQCRQVYGGKHSSVAEITPQDNKAIPVDRIRELISDVSLYSLDGRQRIVIIEPMESLTPQAQNCLLKSLEEPSVSITYFLLSHDSSSLLDTILSRCFVFKLTPWPDEVLIRHLQTLGYPKDKAEYAAILSGGNVGEALCILDEQAGSTGETALRQLLLVASARDAVVCSASLKDAGANALSILLLLEQYLQQCLLVKTGLLNPKFLENTPWAAILHNASQQDLTTLIEQVFYARKLRMSNVNWQSTIDQLIFKLLEAKRTWQKS